MARIYFLFVIGRMFTVTGSLEGFGKLVTGLFKEHRLWTIAVVDEPAQHKRLLRKCFADVNVLAQHVRYPDGGNADYRDTEILVVKTVLVQAAVKNSPEAVFLK